MKKTISLILALMLCLSLYGCGSEKEENAAQTAQPNTEGSGSVITVEKPEEILETSAETTEAIQITEPAITDHPMLSSIYGEWTLIVLEDEANDPQLVPYTNLVFFEDWTCTIDGNNATWKISENSRENQLQNDIELDGADINGAILFDSGYLMCTYGITFYTGTFSHQ